MSTYCYLRVSTDQQDVNSQKIGIEEFCKKHEWNIDGWCMDEGVSGATEPSKRKLGGLLKKCQNGDRLIFSEISRIGRKLVMILDVIKFCSEKGIKIYTVKDRYVLEDTIQSKVLITVMGLAAEIERDLLRQRTKEGLRRAVANGKTLGRPKGRLSALKLDGRIELAKSSIMSGNSFVSTSKLLKVHRITLTNALKRHGWKTDGKQWWDENGNIIRGEKTVDCLGLPTNANEMPPIFDDGRNGDNGEYRMGASSELSTSINSTTCGENGN